MDKLFQMCQLGRYKNISISALFFIDHWNLLVLSYQWLRFRCNQWRTQDEVSQIQRSCQSNLWAWSGYREGTWLQDEEIKERSRAGTTTGGTKQHIDISKHDKLQRLSSSPYCADLRWKLSSIRSYSVKSLAQLDKKPWNITDWLVLISGFMLKHHLET